MKDLVGGSGLAFEDRGEYELKGVPGEWRLYAVERGSGPGVTAMDTEPMHAPPSDDPGR